MTLPPPPPPQGSMYLFSALTPPLPDGTYQVTAETDVIYDPNPAPGQQPPPAPVTKTLSRERYFTVVGPRFTLPATEVAGVYPPANGHGDYHENLPHIVLQRRALPWERDLEDPGHPLIGQPNRDPGDPPPPQGPRPWIALLLFEEGEYTLLRNAPLQPPAIPADVITRLNRTGSTAGITCDIVQADAALVASLMPSVEELQLLAHTRWVNVCDRELNASAGDGWYSVVVSNRVPSSGASYRAVLISVEERSDLVCKDPPAEAPALTAIPGQPVLLDAAPGEVATTAPVIRALALQRLEPVTAKAGLTDDRDLGGGPAVYWGGPDTAALVALYSWTFTCAGTGTFDQLMHHLDTGIIGKVAQAGHPPVTDTGHLHLSVQDRAGATEAAWYRGPLVPYQLTRDSLGPYHSADQARRATPETAAEDVSYAAAFETGLLLAAADSRFAQDLMRWRREAYKQSARASTISALTQRIPLDLPVCLAEQLHTPLTPVVATAAAERIVASDPPLRAPFGLSGLTGAPGLDPAQLAEAWNLASPAEASALLGADPGTLGAVITLTGHPAA